MSVYGFVSQNAVNRIIRLFYFFVPIKHQLYSGQSNECSTSRVLPNTEHGLFSTAGSL